MSVPFAESEPLTPATFGLPDGSRWSHDYGPEELGTVLVGHTLELGLHTRLVPLRGCVVDDDLFDSDWTGYGIKRDSHRQNLPEPAAPPVNSPLWSKVALVSSKAALREVDADPNKRMLDVAAMTHRISRTGPHRTSYCGVDEVQRWTPRPYEKTAFRLGAGALLAIAFARFHRANPSVYVADVAPNFAFNPEVARALLDQKVSTGRPLIHDAERVREKLESLKTADDLVAYINGALDNQKPELLHITTSDGSQITDLSPYPAVLRHVRV